MDTILSKLLTRVSAFLHRAVAYVKSPGPGGFEYLASAVLHAQLEAAQRELARQDKLLAETVAECDGAVAQAAALARETIGLHLQIDGLRLQIPGPETLEQTQEALEASDAELARQDKLLAKTAEEPDSAMAQAAALSRDSIGLREALAARDARVADLTAALAESEKRAVATEREKDRLQDALTQAEAANRAVTEPATVGPAMVEQPERVRSGLVALAVAPPPTSSGAAGRKGAARKETRHREIATQ